MGKVAHSKTKNITLQLNPITNRCNLENINRNFYSHLFIIKMRCFWFSWSFLTWLSAMLCGGGCLLPYWIKGSFVYNMKEFFSDLGLFRRCVYPIRSVKNSIKIIPDCGHYEFIDVPHVYWKVCLVMIIISSSILFFITFFLFILGFCLDILKIETVHKSCQAGQFIAGVLVLISCILYPLGWRSNFEVTQICGDDTSILSLGRCHMGWAFVLTSAGGLLSILSATIPAILMKNSCNVMRRQHGFGNKRNISEPSTTREGIRCGSEVTSFRPFSQNTNTDGTRYSYVSYQSLLGPNTLKSGNSGSLAKYDSHQFHTNYLHPGYRFVAQNHANHLLPSTEASESNKSTNSSKEQDA